MEKKENKDIQSPELENSSSVHALQDIFCEKPASGDFFIKRKNGKTKVEPEFGQSFFRINPTFFLKLSLEGKMAFSLLLMLKKYSSHGRIWNYNSSIVSSKIGVSKYYLEKYIPVLVKKRYCYFNMQGDLVLVSLNKIMGHTRLGRVIVGNCDSVKNIVNKINYSVFVFSCSQQNFVRRLKRNEHQANKPLKSNRSNLAPVGSKSILKERKACAKIKERWGGQVRGEFFDYNLISIRGLAKKLNCSTKKAVCFLNVLRKNKVIKTRERVEICNILPNTIFYSDQYKEIMNKKIGYYFSVGRFVYRHLGTEVIFTDQSLGKS